MREDMEFILVILALAAFIWLCAFGGIKQAEHEIKKQKQGRL